MSQREHKGKTCQMCDGHGFLCDPGGPEQCMCCGSIGHECERCDGEGIVTVVEPVVLELEQRQITEGE